MELEQLEFGSVGVDVIHVHLSYQWGPGWTCKLAWRHSGAEGFLEQSYTGRDEAELHALVTDALATLWSLV